MRRTASISLVEPQLKAMSWCSHLEVILGESKRQQQRAMRQVHKQRHCRHRLSRKVLNQIELDAARAFGFTSGLPLSSNSRHYATGSFVMF